MTLVVVVVVVVETNLRGYDACTPYLEERWGGVGLYFLVVGLSFKKNLIQMCKILANACDHKMSSPTKITQSNLGRNSRGRQK